MDTAQPDYSAISAHVPETVRAVLRQLRTSGHEAWLAGGCVRDLILGRTPQDFDITTSAGPGRVQAIFRRTIPTGIQHGTVTVLIDDPVLRAVEVTTYRGEGAYSDGRRPESVQFLTEGKPGDLELDLSRRDFTVNAMAFDPEVSELRDPNGGLDDLKRKLIRCVGNPLVRFSEDGLRTLRAVRFCSTLEFDLDAATRAAIPLAMETFRKVSAERVRDELNKLLVKSPMPSRGLQLLAETGLLAEILPEIVARGTEHFDHVGRTVDGNPPDLVLRLVALLHMDEPGKDAIVLAQTILERLRYPRATMTDVRTLLIHYWIGYDQPRTDTQVRQTLSLFGKDALPREFALREAEIRARQSGVAEGLLKLAAFRARLEVEIQRGSPVSLSDLAISGEDLVAALGRSPGPWVGMTLRSLMSQVLEDPTKNTRERLLFLAGVPPKSG